MAEKGEDPRQTFIREAREEINALSDNLVELPMFEVDQTWHGVYVMELRDSEHARLKLGDEGQRFDFYSIDQALELPLTHTTQAFFKHEAELIRRYVD